MNEPFRLTPQVAAFLAALVVGNCLIALWMAEVSLLLGMLGVFSVGAMWFKVALRTRKWLWWDFGIVALTRWEGFIGMSGAVLFASAFLALTLVIGTRHS